MLLLLLFFCTNIDSRIIIFFGLIGNTVVNCFADLQRGNTCQQLKYCIFNRTEFGEVAFCSTGHEYFC